MRRSILLAAVLAVLAVLCGACQWSSPTEPMRQTTPQDGSRCSGLPGEECRGRQRR